MSVFQQGQKWHYVGAADQRKISTLSKQERKSKLLSAAACLPRSLLLFLHSSCERVYLLKPISCFITKHPVKFNKTPPLRCSVSNVLSKCVFLMSKNTKHGGTLLTELCRDGFHMITTQIAFLWGRRDTEKEIKA